MKPAAQRYEREPHKSKPQYQFEMGTKSLLAAFFALAIVCGLFFAFGYTIGKHTIPAAFTLGAAKPPTTTAVATPIAPGVQPPNPQQLGAAEANQTPVTLTNTPAGTANAANAGNIQAPNAAAPSGVQSTTAVPPASVATTAADSAASRHIAPPAAPPAASQNSSSALALPAPQASTAAGAAAADANGSQVYEVQVFAGTSSDAGSLTTALQGRGYPASVVAPSAGSGNSLYRVEVGPYLTRAEAEAMRARLRADGYQAVLRIGQ